MKKTEFLPFSCNSTYLYPFNDLLISNRQPNLTIQLTNSIKYLGVCLDRFMRCDIHIKYVIRKLETILFKFRFMKKYLSRGDLKNLYYALVESHLKYDNVVWGAALRIHLNPLKIVQFKILKIIMSKHYHFFPD